MSAPINARAHGKVNLFLGVDSVRDDGYHNLVTVFQSISAHNDVTLTPVPDVSAARDSVVTELTVSGLDAAKVPTDSTNLAWRAVDAIAAIARVGASEAALPCLRVHIAKSIPTAGGMAGGSADAAAALVAANEFYGTGLGLDDLLRVAATLGADVPFCVRGGTCLAPAAEMSSFLCCRVGRTGGRLLYHLARAFLPRRFLTSWMGWSARRTWILRPSFRRSGAATSTRLRGRYTMIWSRLR